MSGARRCVLSEPWTTAQLTADLAGKLRADQFLVAAEATLRAQTGQRADLLAMHRKLTDLPMVIFEIKTSRSDLLRDLKSEKWRGYLVDGAVAFAFPAGLADPREIPNEAGVIVRIANGWSWRRAPRWADAPRPTPYLYRRMALTASDQAAERVRADMTPRASDLWSAGRKARKDNGRRLAQIAQNIDVYEKLAAEAADKYSRQLSIRDRLEREVRELEGRKRVLERLL